MTISTVSRALSAEGLPSGCRSGDTSNSPSAVNSAVSLAPNIFNAAGLPEVNFHEGGAMVIMASHEPSNSRRCRASLSRSASSASLRPVMSVMKPCQSVEPSASRCGIALPNSQRTVPSSNFTRNSWSQGDKSRADIWMEATQAA
jgi:hypothetical protein